MSDAFRLQLLFKKYLNRSCSSRELEELVKLLSRADAEDILTPAMREVWEKIKPEDDTRHNVNWDRMYAEITESSQLTDIAIQPAHSKRRWIKYAAAAAAIVIAAIVFRVSPGNNGEAKPENPLLTTLPKNSPQAPAKHKQIINLPDGSTVILNTGSQLKYPSGFSDDRRDVYLTGEGFFDIRHDTNKPFYVHSGAITIKVLGTAFNIKMDTAQHKIEVTVTRGKVQVMNKDKSVGIITASKQLSFNESTAAAVTKMVDTTGVIAWKPVEIYFNDITMEAAAKKIEERFGIPVEFEKPSAKNCRITATFSEADLVDEILTVICAVSQTTYTISNNKIFINGKGCD